ncbi:MAG: hypothetical protein A3C80_00530 [Candidatus Ryanbacteria bacterium RIFCSPHIGHO2_02_FULL_45_43]|uniref:Uncharacterized protein n=1 Tax=Candidatus Ryanbacteria bacterium RIFCSPHIGHO2_01_45_13 TaxID=1802112 RepID=A0A1G2FYR2_9BACT|nr:MAG: hypothetical protein A2718_01920 [Candidatus Ryanbacteria bacterium RIFCSPHIGHO2_01_FULL_44_130]OGZ42711.1 MAG: hypothetical protein A2W41_03145 [Candidatus Ryanbacteria bacterium RIFCSPHIGHO2_01_45_13]OGZ48801.1 MAG: hypothetical protein A3C80_00530 [Candidatus Ryanbacteria bacterium RIFCSPHIGHO2_02_FULL_45_43]OGZ50833.1 MAG: hypothetical protein A3E55_02550 [Candidatus Ryanbacteria bacterium RIFCSPHIGHO2_12_FULL_44_20]OGZ52044.1 MAG: hypothetical protein A3A17_01135 [Candidatus Ryanba
MSEKDFKKLLGSRILGEANDLKRTIESLASELGMDAGKMQAVIRGEASVEEARAIIAVRGCEIPRRCL